MKHTIKKLPKSKIEIEVEIEAAELDKFLDKALAHATEHIEVDGFRKGNVPKNIVEEKVNKEVLLTEAADLAVNDAYSKIIAEQKIEPISQPEIEVQKLARGNPFQFKLKVTLLPEIQLPDYKKIASQIKKQKLEVTDEEIQDTLNHISKTRAKFSAVDREVQNKDYVEIEYSSTQVKGLEKPVKDQFILGEGGLIPGFEDNIVGMKSGSEKEFVLKFPANSQRKDLAGKDITFKVKILSIQKVEIPEVNDEFAKALGKFTDLTALKANIKEGILFEKEEQEKQRMKNEVIEKIANASKFEVPENLIILEQDRMFKNFQEKVKKDLNMTLEEYLKSIKQDEKQMKESFTKEAERKVKNFLVMKEIGKVEHIIVGDEEVETEANNSLKNYPIDLAKKIDISELKEYTKGVIYQEKVFQRLESFIENN